MTLHDLKTWPEPFDAVDRGDKRYEIRQNDRGFQVGDVLRLRRYDPHERAYTGQEIYVKVTYITPGGQWGLPPTLCVMSIALLASADRHQATPPNE